MVKRSNASQRLAAALGLSLLILAVLPIIAGCGSDKKSADVAEHAPPVRVEKGGFVVSLDADPNKIIKGMRVSMSLTVQNLSGSNRTFNLSTAQEFEIKAFNSAGSEVWKWSTGQMFAQVVTPVTINTGSTKIYTGTWDTNGQAPGVYEVKGYFLGLADIVPVDIVIIQ